MSIASETGKADQVCFALHDCQRAIEDLTEKMDIKVDELVGAIEALDTLQKAIDEDRRAVKGLAGKISDLADALEFFAETYEKINETQGEDERGNVARPPGQ